MNKGFNDRQIDVCSVLFTELANKNTIKITTSLLNEDKSYLQLLQDTKIDSKELSSKLTDLIDLRILRYKDKEELFTISDASILNIMRQAVSKTNHEIFFEM